MRVLCWILLVILSPVMSGCSTTPVSNVTVLVSGVGVTVEEARKSAFRDAIQEAYGTLTLSERRVKNDILFEDDVSYARGVIEKYQILSSNFDRRDQLYRISMQVTVSPTTIQRRLLDSQDGQKIDGGRLGNQMAIGQAQSKSEIDKYMGARRLFEHVSRDIGKSVFDVKVGEIKTIRNGQEITTTVSVKVGTNPKVVNDLCLATKELKNSQSESLNIKYKSNLNYFVVNHVFKCSIFAQIENGHFMAMQNSLLNMGFCIELLNDTGLTLNKTFSKDWKLIDDGWVPGPQFLPKNVKGYRCGMGGAGCSYDPQGPVQIKKEHSITILRGAFGAGDQIYPIKLPGINPSLANKIDSVKVTITDSGSCR
jgi:hypothetical protein